MVWDEELERLGFEYLDEGCFRRVFVRGKIVIKVPLNFDGEIDNLIEARAWHQFRNRPTPLGLRLAPCRLLPNNYLLMVKVRVLDDCDPLVPAWAEAVDNYQVGVYRGKVVAFDYALNLRERFKWEDEMNIKSEFFRSKEWEERNPHLFPIMEEPF